MIDIKFFASIVFISATIAGCSSDGDERRQEYLDADYYTRLELPPDLTAPDNSKQMTTPVPEEEAIKKFRRDSDHVGTENQDSETLPATIAMSVKGARMRTGDGVFWLEVDENADKLWTQLSAFWSNEGIRIVRNEPMLGIVETDWVNKLQVDDDDAGFFSRMFSNVEPDRLDKFRMRVEPDGGFDKTRIYMSHTGIELFVEGDDINWRSRCTEEELEREILNRLALYVGLDKKRAEKVFENYRPFASRVRISEDETNILYVTGTVEFVWKRVQRAMDRMGTVILQSDLPNRTLKVAVTKLTRDDLGLEKDELAESSWVMQWLTGEGGDTIGDIINDEDRQFLIKHTENNGVVRLDILRPDGEVPESVLAEQFRARFAIELR